MESHNVFKFCMCYKLFLLLTVCRLSFHSHPLILMQSVLTMNHQSEKNDVLMWRSFVFKICNIKHEHIPVYMYKYFWYPPPKKKIENFKENKLCFIAENRSLIIMVIKCNSYVVYNFINVHLYQFYSHLNLTMLLIFKDCFENH